MIFETDENGHCFLNLILLRGIQRAKVEEYV